MKYTLSRLINLCRAEWSYLLSCLGLSSVKHMPVFVSVEPADFCQLHCPQCPVGMTHRTERHCISMDLFRSVLEQVAPYAHTMQFYFQGEPLLHQNLAQMIAMAHDEGLYTIVSTNAQLLDETTATDLVASGLSRIIVSMDGATQTTYEQYRVGGHIERVLNGLQLLRQAKQRLKSNITIELQCLCLRSNEHEWNTLRRHYRLWGADRLTLKTAQFYDFKHGNALMPSNEHYSRYRRQSDGSYILYRPWWQRLWKHLTNLTPCHRLWTGCVITAQGKVLPCCYDKNAAHSYGTLTTQSDLSTIFSSQLSRSFRLSVLHHSDQLDLCRNCDH